jgi:mono/diheme cytochrome c family protein
MRSVRHSLTVLVMAIGVIVAGSAWGQGQTPMQHQHKDEQTATKPPAPIRTTMEALHASGGVPKGWKFLVPPGDQARGREAFVTLECFACHTVRGEDFPKTSKRSQEPGPDLTGMGAHHPAEYFAESIVNPNRVIVQGQGYTGADGLSKMPDYADVMTVGQLTDLVAYLKSLKGGMMHDHGKTMDMPGRGMKGMKATDRPKDMPGHDMKK